MIYFEHHSKYEFMTQIRRKETYVILNWKETRLSESLASGEKDIQKIYETEVYSEPCQTSEMELFAKISNSCLLLPIFAKSSILDA